MNYRSPLQHKANDKYDDSPREDIIELIQFKPSRILEIGCAAGATGERIKTLFPECFYAGIEIDEGFSKIAATRIDLSVCSNIEQKSLSDIGFSKKEFDLIICADVLEHLYNPWKLLHQLSNLITENGYLIASIPNSQHFSILQELASGRFRYQPHGLLDATHIRFFTFLEIVDLFRNTGWLLESCARKLTHRIDQYQFPCDFNFGKITVKNVTREEAANFHTFQFLLVAKKHTERPAIH